MSAELAQLQSDIDAQTEAFLRKGGTVTKLNWAGVPVDGTVIEPKPVAAWGRNYERVAIETAAKATPAPTAEAPQVKALPLVEAVPAPTAPNKVSVPVVDHPATHRAMQLRASARRACISAELRAIHADARYWLARLDARFPR